MPHSQRASLVWVAAGRGLRLGLILLVAWLSLSTARSIYQLLRPTQPAAKADLAAADAPPPADLFRQLPAEGYWTFHDFPWRVAKTEKNAAEAPGAELAEPLLPLGPPTPQEQAFLASLQTLADRSTPLPTGAMLYRLAGQFPIEVTTKEVQGVPRLLSASIALPSSHSSTADRQTRLQLLPKSAADDSPARVSHLLPLPAGSLRTFARWTNTGELLLEFVETPRTLSNLLADWRAAGWEIRLTPGASGVGSSYLCANGGRLIIVYVQQAGENSTGLLLASRPQPKP